VKDHIRQLEKELKQAGATSAEVAALVPIASSLGLLKAANPAVKRGWKHILTRAFKPTLTLVAGASVGMALVMFSQSVLPTSWLYPVQKMADSVAVKVDPAYRAAIMMKRAQQVDQLVAINAKASVVLATLADYNSAASAYKSAPHANYAAFEYCKTNLRQAAAAAPAAVHKAILASLSSLETS
jgi:hypothetical protein